MSKAKQVIVAAVAAIEGKLARVAGSSNTWEPAVPETGGFSNVQHATFEGSQWVRVLLPRMLAIAFCNGKHVLHVDLAGYSNPAAVVLKLVAVSRAKFWDDVNHIKGRSSEAQAERFEAAKLEVEAFLDENSVQKTERGAVTRLMARAVWKLLGGRVKLQDLTEAYMRETLSPAVYGPIKAWAESTHTAQLAGEALAVQALQVSLQDEAEAEADETEAE